MVGMIKRTTAGLSALLFLATAASADPVADFIASDRNGNGTLESAEFREFIKARAEAGDGSAKWVVRFGAWGRALSTVDINKDGIVTGDELRAYERSR